jgi:hypothetical protein
VSLDGNGSLSEGGSIPIVYVQIPRDYAITYTASNKPTTDIATDEAKGLTREVIIAVTCDPHSQ